MKYKARFYLLCCRMTGKKVRKLWNDVDMVAAIKAVKTNQMTTYCAANHFHVPRKTLDARIKGHVEHGSKPGRNPVLSAVEEEALVVYHLYMADRGFPLTRTLLKAFAWTLAKRSGNGDHFNAETGPWKHWWTNFKSGHPE